MKKINLILVTALLASLMASSQPVKYEVYALRFASTAHAWPIAEWAVNGPVKDSVNINFMIWLIKGSNGKNILLDAGFINDIQDAKEFDIINFIRPDSVLRKINLRPEDITDIILSHPHWDHIDGIDLFPNARVWMQTADFNYFIGAAWQKDGRRGGFNKRDVHKLIDINMAGRLNFVNGDNIEIIPGIRVYTGSRHTFNSQYARVATGSGDVVLASDNIWIYYNLDHLAPGGTSDTTGYINQMKRMKTMVSDVKYIIPGHDAALFSKFPVITEGVIKIK